MKFFLIGVVVLGSFSMTFATDLWWEAEKTTKTNFPAKSWFNPQNDKEKAALSEGKWLSIDKDRNETLFAEYALNIPAAGEYDFWVRKFWKHGPFKYRFGDGAWASVGRDVKIADSVSLRTHVGANWVYLGKVKLDKEKTICRIELTENKGAAAFDCFYLTQTPFTPRGKLKPGAKLGLTEEGYFAFEPDADPYKKAALDLSGLNIKPAGKFGFIQRAGEHLVFSRSLELLPLGFWGVNAHPTGNAASDKQLAKFLAKRGVNLVRVHGRMWEKGQDPTKINPKTIAELQSFAAACKEEGIYLYLSIYFPLWMEVQPSFGLGDYSRIKGGKHPFGLLFFHPRFQEIHRAWVKALLTTKDPTTGKSLAGEPSLAMIEIVNEDNCFFWTFDPEKNMSPEAQKMLEAQYAQWLLKKYGTTAKLAAAWGKGVKIDELAAGRVQILSPWQYTLGAAKMRNPQRMADQLEFLTTLQRDYFAQTIAWMKKDLGVKSMVVCGNWKTSSEPMVGALDKYTYMAGDVIDEHAYWHPGHKGQGASWSIRKGHAYQDGSMLFTPCKSPFGVIQYQGYPLVFSEFNYPAPNRFRAEAIPLMAAYGALQGVDGFMFFAFGRGWDGVHGKFPLGTPVSVGQFPAAALMYRGGYIQPAPVVVNEDLPLKYLYDLKGSKIDKAAGFDALRAADAPKGGEAEAKGPFNPMSFYIGQVQRNVDAKTYDYMVNFGEGGIDTQKKQLLSATGQLLWDYGKGVVRINAPKAQGAVGFLKAAGEIKLSDIMINSGNEYASILVVSMDAKPLKDSKKILLQVVTEDQSYGWKTSGSDMKTIESVGGPPMQVRQIKGTVDFGKGDWTAAPCDANGYAMEPVLVKEGVLTLKPDMFYYILTR